MHNPKVVLVIMDGWGYSPVHKGNAIWAAKTPNFDYLWSHYAHTLLNAFGENVGLPWGAIGSSEVGHTSIGSGNLIHQELSLVDKEIQDGSFFNNGKILESVRQAKENDKSIHLIGLISNGGVHSNLNHLYALLKLLKKKGFTSNIFIHMITDGRDTAPKSASLFARDLEKEINKININARIATVCGRFFAMDRDNHWDRTKKSYLVMTAGVGNQADSVDAAIQDNYKKNISDEFIEPTIINLSTQNNFFGKLFNKSTSKVNGLVQKGDSVIFFNIRADRMRQITEMFLFKRDDVATTPVSSGNVLTLTTYNEYLPVSVAYPAIKIKNPLAKLLSDHAFSQGHFAETEKYAHVTYFFNGGNPEPYPKEVWELVHSPNVRTYDQKPEMSADQVTDKVFETLKKNNLDFVLINYANADMVGHTGVFDKVVLAAEAVDKQLGRLRELMPATTLMITADHGNAECMIHPETGEVDKMHTVNPVPFILVNDAFLLKSPKNDADLKPSGILADIAPTILSFFDIKTESSMNGISLIDVLK